LVHVRGEERECSTEERSENRVGSQDGGGENGVGVNEIVHNTEEDKNHAESEGNTGSDTGHPVDARIVGPGEPEKANRQTDRTDKTSGETSLRRGEATVLLLDLDLALVLRDGVCDSQEHADHDAKEGQAADTRVPAAVLLVHNRESTEKHVEGTVDDSHVDGEEKDNRLLEEQDPGSRQGSLERLGKSNLTTLIVNLADVDMSCDLGELGGTSSEKDGGVCLGDQESTDNPESTREGTEEAHDPAPTSVHAEEASNDGAKDGSEEGSSSEDGHGETTLRGREHVGDGTTGVGER